MIDKISNFIFVRVYAAGPTGGIFDFFKAPTSGTNAAVGDAPGSFKNILTLFLQWFLAIIGIMAFIYLVMSGVKYITAGGDAAKATEARNGIINAIIGIMVIAIAFTIMRFAAGIGSTVTGQLH